jgi:hypothetical protein
MQRLVRDLIIAIAGALVGGVLLSFITNLSRIQLIGVAIGILLLCSLILGGLRLPGYVERRYREFKAGLVASVKEQVLAELAADVSLRDQSRGTNPASVLRALNARSRADPKRNLADLAERGRMLQGRVRYSNATNVSVPAGLSSEVGDWEGAARTALIPKPQCLQDFDAAPGLGGAPIVGRVVSRLEQQIAAVERAVREFDGATATS